MTREMYLCTQCGARFPRDKAIALHVCPYCSSRSVVQEAEQKGLLTLTCPFCGGAFSLPDSYNMSSCPYCSRRLFLRMTDNIMQFFFDPGKDREFARQRAQTKGFVQEANMLYLPFWALKGTLVTWALGYKKEDDLLIKQSMRYAQATTAEGGPMLPTSMKKKTPIKQFSSKLIFISFADYAAKMLQLYTLATKQYVENLVVKNMDALSREADILKPLFDREEVLNHLLDSVFRRKPQTSDKVVVEMTRMDLLGERYLLIYSPFYRFTRQGRSLLIDAISGETYEIADTVLFDTTPKRISDKAFYDQKKGFHNAEFAKQVGALELVPFVCPVCGHDLPDKKLDFVVQCGNCTQYFLIEKGELTEIPVLYALPRAFSLPPPSGSTVLYYPYWRYQTVYFTRQRKIARVDELKSLFPGFQDTEQRPPRFERLHMYIPAYGRIKTPGVDRLAPIYTRKQIVFDTQEHMAEEKEKVAVIYNREDARDFAYTIFLKAYDLKTRAFQRLRNTFIRLSHPQLIYFPFLLNKQGAHTEPMLGMEYARSAFVAERSY